MFNPLLSQSLYIFVSRMVGYALRLVLPYFLVRLLTVGDFGAYRQFFLLSIYIEALFQLGLNQALYYFIPRDVPNGGAYFLNSIFMNLIVFVVAFTVVGVAVQPLSNWLNMSILQDAFWLLAGYVVVLMLAVACDCFLTARRSVRAAAFFEIFGQTVTSGACVAAAVATRELMPVLAVMVIARSVHLLAMLAFIHFRLHGFRSERYFFGIGEQVRYGVILGLAGTLVTLMTRMHEFFVSRYYGTEAYAVYSAGCTELPLIQIFTQSVALVALGQFAKLEQEKDWEGIEHLWRRVTTSSYAVAVPVVALLLVSAKPIVLFMFTDTYSDAVAIFQVNTVLKLGLIFNATLVLRAMSRNDISIWVNTVALALSVPMLFAGMKVGGMVGIIAAQAVIMIGSRVALVAVMNRTLERPLPYRVSIREVLDFYREYWNVAIAAFGARRRRRPGGPDNAGGA